MGKVFIVYDGYAIIMSGNWAHRDFMGWLEMVAEEVQDEDSGEYTDRRAVLYIGIHKKKRGKHVFDLRQDVVTYCGVLDG